ncbi:MAG: aldo/keto reductase [Rothia sp. (in: high G+C Gram-positive bacteria)]|nr:aldo/keto reductase [Rothia sp. (in: high G+C Gram-positive bacteria)]
MQDHIMRDSNPIPPLGLGTYGLSGSQGEAIIAEAIRAGYRLIDTAVRYENEDAVGRAVNRCGLKRQDIFVTSKVPGADHGTEQAIASIKSSLQRMQLDYLDLVLIHWPNPSQNRYLETWQGLIQAQEEGLTKSIGVSNFLPHHIDLLIEETGHTPVVNQLELNPYHQQKDIQDYNANQAIISQCWAPLGRKTDLLKNETVADLAQEIGRTAAQVILRWHVQQQLLPIPKSSQLERVKHNLDVFTWELDPDQMQLLDQLDRKKSGFGFDPNYHEEM